MRKKILALVLVLSFGILPLAGCGGESSSEESTGSSSSAEVPTLVVANWQGYGSDEEFGADRFEELYNCKVEHVYFTSLEELMTTIQTGGMGEIDVALPSNSYLQIFREAGLLEEVDTSKITCYDDLLEDYVGLSYAEEGGKVYGIPWTWGTTSLGYNPEYITEDLNSWDALWDEKYQGKVAFFDDYVTAIMTGAIHNGMDASDPASIDLDVVKEDLINLKQNIRTYWASYDDYLNPYSSGDVTLGNMWAGTATSLINEGSSVKFVSPPEGTVGYVDYWAIIKGTKNYDLACKWLDFMAGEEFQTNFATVEGNAHNTVNKVVYDKLTQEQKEVLWCDPLPEKIYMQPALTDEQKNEWLQVWNDVKAS